MTFTQKLNQHKGIFVKEKYDKKPMPEVSAYLKQFRLEMNRTDGTVYNSELKEYIMRKEKLEVDIELLRYLETEVYLAQQDATAERKEAHKQKMLSEGFLELTPATEYRGKIELKASRSVDWMTSDVSQKAKIITSGDKSIFIIPSGWYLRSLENVFYKPVN